MSRVTRNIAPGQLSRLVEEEARGTRNASTSTNTTRYYETVPANQLEAMLWAHAERMGRSVLDQSVFDAERSIVKEEMRQRRQVETTGGLGSFLTGLAVPGLPMTTYAQHLPSIAAVTPAQIATSVAAELDPAQASIVIAGRASEFLPQLRSQYPNVELVPLDQFDSGTATLRRAAAAD